LRLIFFFQIGPGLKIKKGMRVDMPLYACHHDPDYFPDPEKFLPERFLRGNVESIPQYAFRPFGGETKSISYCLFK
jgi:cytochrome P450